METKNQLLTSELISKSYSYDDYRALIGELLLENKTTGENQSDDLLGYTKLNVQRMNKWDKIAKISSELQDSIDKIDTPTHWVILTEAWCGDAAQNLPLIAKAAASNPNISLHLLLRDENMELMDQYLTNGGRSIPKMITLDANLKETGTWGPRPLPVQEELMKMKADGDFSYEQFGVVAHTWYAKDRTKTLQQELIQVID